MFALCFNLETLGFSRLHTNQPRRLESPRRRGNANGPTNRAIAFRKDPPKTAGPLSFAAEIGDLLKYFQAARHRQAGNTEPRAGRISRKSLD